MTITNSRILINAQSATENVAETDPDRLPIRYHQKQGVRFAELARVTKSSFPRSLSRSSSRRCPIVVRAAAASEAAEKCFRTNWRALIDEATESFPRNRGSSEGRFIVASHRERGYRACGMHEKRNGAFQIMPISMVREIEREQEKKKEEERKKRR